MNKRPDKRITIDKVKQHEFFKGLDWEKLGKKEIPPPVHLKSEDPQEEDDDDELLFLKKQEGKFKDRDYTADN